MWLFTNKGFYSVVKKDGTDYLTVRSRVRHDLVRLTEVMPTMTEIVANAGTDYPFRSTISFDDFAVGMARLVYAIDYSNFKSMVYAVFGEVRENLYSSVWCVMNKLVNKNDKKYLKR